MKRVVYSPAALASLREILTWTIDHFGEAQARRYSQKLIGRLRSLASGQPPHARSCAALLPDEPRAAGLVYVREGQHYLILRESADSLELIELFHARMDIEARVRGLMEPFR